MDKKKKSGLHTLIYTFGTLLIAVFMVIVVINFVRDARVFQKPVLSTSNEKKNDTTGTDGYKTIKYQKPATESTKQSSKKTDKTPAASPKPTETTAPTTPDP